MVDKEHAHATAIVRMALEGIAYWSMHSLRAAIPRVPVKMRLFNSGDVVISSGYARNQVVVFFSEFFRIKYLP